MKMIQKITRWDNISLTKDSFIDIYLNENYAIYKELAIRFSNNDVDIRITAKDANGIIETILSDLNLKNGWIDDIGNIIEETSYFKVIENGKSVKIGFGKNGMTTKYLRIEAKSNKNNIESYGFIVWAK